MGVSTVCPTLDPAREKIPTLKGPLPWRVSIADQGCFPCTINHCTVSFFEIKGTGPAQDSVDISLYL